jgi:hypothetical protein
MNQGFPGSICCVKDAGMGVSGFEGKSKLVIVAIKTHTEVHQGLNTVWGMFDKGLYCF